MKAERQRTKGVAAVFRRFIQLFIWPVVAAGNLLMAEEEYLPDARRTNGADTLRAFATVQAGARAVTVFIGESREAAPVAGAIMSSDGYILTKNSETLAIKKLRVWLPDGTSADARVVKRDDALDLALLKTGRAGLQSVPWGASLPLRPAQWLTAGTDHGRDFRLGVFSAKRRAVRSSGAVMGVRFARADKGDIGLLIEEVAPDGPADKAGLQAEDVLLSLNNERVNALSAVRRIIAGFRPGDVVKLKYKRKGADAECEVTLASRNHVMMNWGGGDFGNHGTSVRTDNFPEVIQHDMPLSPQDMGGVLFDLEGHAVGINIARVDRVTNYALPAEAFLPQVTKWMQDDRAGRK